MFCRLLRRMNCDRCERSTRTGELQLAALPGRSLALFC